MVSKLDASRLEALLESAHLLQASLDLDTSLRHVLRTAMGRLLARRGLIAVRQPEGDYRLELARGLGSLETGARFDRTAAFAAGVQELLPIGPAEAPVGFLGLGGFPAAGQDADEWGFVQALLGLAASVISNAQAHESAVRANQLLDQRLQELRALLDLGRGLASSLDAHEVASLVGFTLAGRWAVSKYAVLAWHDGQPPVQVHRGIAIPEPGPWQTAMAEWPDAVLHDELTDAAWRESWPLPAGCLVLPIRSNETVCGVIVCGPRSRGSVYRETDREFGAGLAAQAAVAFEYAWHLRDTLLRQQMEQEVSLAAQIQKDLFPARLPALLCTELAARNRQARQVGGDLFDVLPFDVAGPDQRHLLCVADIAGKGLPASLLMSNIQATLRALLRRDSLLSDVACRANDLLYASTPPNRYATAFLLAADPCSGECRFVNCGHNSAILLRAGGAVELLDCTGLALGLFPRQTYEEQAFHLAPGDLLAVYSDGINEAWNEEEDEFGMDRLIESLRRNRGRPMEEMMDHLFAELDEFVGLAPQHDDMTLLLLRRTE